MRKENILPYAPVLIKLLQDVLYQEETAHWDMLLRHARSVQEYFEKIGVQVYIDEPEGYAYLRQHDEEDEEGQEPSRPLPRLVRRDRLSFHVTLLCVLLRERLQQFDTSASGSTRLVLHTDDLNDLIRPFFKERTDEVRMLRTFDAIIKQTADLGFLKRLTGAEENLYEVRRILKAKISADILFDIKEKMKAYAESAHV